MNPVDLSMDVQGESDSEDAQLISPTGSTVSTIMDYKSDQVLRCHENFDSSYLEEDLLASVVDTRTMRRFGPQSLPAAPPAVDPKWDGFAPYDRDYLSWLLHAETRLNVFDENAPFVGIRRLLIGWLNDACAAMEIPVTTARAALALLDYVLTLQPEVPVEQMDLVGLGCIVAACKYAEIETQKPLLYEVMNVVLNRYTFEEVKEAELFVLRVTDWRLDTITPSHFIAHHQQRFPEQYTDPMYVDLIESLVDCSLLDYGCRNCRPSLIAEGVIKAARMGLGMPEIPFIICAYPSQNITQVAELIITIAEDYQQELVDNQQRIN